MSSPIVTELDTSVSHLSETLVEVLVDGIVEDVLDVPTGGTVVMDAGRDARARLDLTAVGIERWIPTEASDPLNVYGSELRVARGIAGVGLVRLGVFGIDRSTTPDPGGTIQVSGRDRAGRFIGNEGAFESAGFITSGTLAGAAILEVLLDSWPQMPYNAAAFDAITVPLPAVAWDEGEDRWAFASGIATAIGGELYFDRNGELTIQQVPTPLASNAVAALMGGDGGTLLEITRDWDRSRVINRWTVTGTNPSNDSDAPVPRGVALDNEPSSPTYYYGRFGKRLDSVSNSFVGTDVQASDMAAGLLARSIGAPDSISFGAIIDPARSPLDVVNIERSRLGIAAAHVLDSVTHPLDVDGAMTAETRITQALS